MYLTEKHKVRSQKNGDNTFTFWLMEEIGDGRYRQIDSVTTKHPEVAYIQFQKKIKQMT